MPTQSDRSMSEQRNSIIVAVTLALVSAFILGGVSLALFPSQPNSPTLSEKASLLTGLESTPSIRDVLSSIASFSKGFSLDAICIQSDGSLNSTSVPITRVGDTYTFVEDVVNLTVLVQRDNIVIDGAGHRLQGFKTEEEIYAMDGLILDGRSNVTVKNLVLNQFGTAISVYNSSRITITGNTFVDNDWGVTASSVTYSKIVGNNFKETLCESIGLVRPSEGETSLTPDNLVSGNNITGGNFGINAYSSSSNIITWNNLTFVYTPITAGENTTVANNNMVDGIDGITLLSHCSIYQNTVLI